MQRRDLEMGVAREELRPEPARPSDATALARLVVREGMRAPGEDVWDVGTRRAARDEGGFSYRKAQVIRQEGRVIAGLVGYPLEELTPGDAAADAPAMFRPLVALENKAVPSWYVNVLATFPEARGKGAARALLRDAENRARLVGCDRMSLITGNDNPALTLCRHFGYAERSRAPVVRDGWDGTAQEWILLMKAI